MMDYRLENKKININRMNPVDTFNGGNIYNFKNTTLKIYDKDFEEVRSEKTIRYLSKIKSLQIYMPVKLIYNNNKFCGYSVKNIPRNGSYHKIISTPKDYLLDSLFNLEEEIKYISNKRVLFSDLDYDDIYYNGEFSICNPDKYMVLSNQSDTIYDTNLLELNSLLSKLITKELNSENVTKKNIVNFNNIFRDKDIYVSNCDYLDDLLSDSQDIKSYVKTLK